MSEPRHIIFDRHGNRIAWSKFGVIWFENGDRVGSFAGDKILNNQNHLVARLIYDRVETLQGDRLGLIVPDEESGKFFIKIDDDIVGNQSYPKALAAGIIGLLHQHI